MVGISFGSAFNVFLLLSLPPGFGLCLLFALVPCPGSSKKSDFHRVVGFGPGPGFNSVDLRADTIPVASPPPPLGLKPSPVLCCPEENMKFGSKRKSRDPRLQSLVSPSCCLPQHMPFFSPSVI